MSPAPLLPLLARSSSVSVGGSGDYGGDGRVAMAAVLFGTATFLRQSNYLPATLGRESPHLIRRGQVRSRGSSLLVVVDSTKTNLWAEEPVSLLICPPHGSHFCPVAACRWLGVRCRLARAPHCSCSPPRAAADMRGPGSPHPGHPRGLGRGLTCRRDHSQPPPDWGAPRIRWRSPRR